MSPLGWLVYRTLVSGLFGLILGSFFNVLIYRLPRGENIAQGRSRCPACGHPLAAADLVPLISYLLLHKRCRYCQSPIASRYPAVEALTGVLAAAVAGFWGSGIFSPAAGARPLWAWIPLGPTFNTLMVVLYLVASLSLLVLTFIIWDGNKPPPVLWVLVALPAGLRFVLQPDRLLLHVAGALAAALCHWLFFRPAHRRSLFLLALIGWVTGLWAVSLALVISYVWALLIKRPGLKLPLVFCCACLAGLFL